MRISRECMFMDIASVVARRSTCNRLNVGAIIVRNNRIISMGYNGQPPGDGHCNQLCPAGGCRSIHAEINALDYATGHVLSDCAMYVTDSPCLDCGSRILACGIPRLYYRTPYRDMKALSLLRARGVLVYRVLPSGAVIGEHDVEQAV